MLRTRGLPWRELLTVGTLVNTRGLIELVVLNMGLDRSII
jgi:Kef-type K+ transport system membrane component KefB